MAWLSSVVAASLHPGAAHVRQQAALELLTAILDTWDIQAAPSSRVNSVFDGM